MAIQNETRKAFHELLDLQRAEIRRLTRKRAQPVAAPGQVLGERAHRLAHARIRGATDEGDGLSCGGARAHGWRAF